MHEYYQQAWYFKNEERIDYKYIPLTAVIVIDILLIKTCLR